MKLSLWLSILLQIIIFPVMAIDVVLVSNLPGPSNSDVSDLYDNNSFDWSSFQFPVVLWTGRQTCLYEAKPWYFELDVTNGTYKHNKELLGLLGSAYTSMTSFKFNDFILFEYGEYGPLTEKKYGLFDGDINWRDISDIGLYKKVSRSRYPSEKSVIKSLRANEDFGLPLLGDYALVPQPKVDQVQDLEFMDIQTHVSIKNIGNGNLIILPKEYKIVRSDGLRVAVSFNRFRIAMIGQVIQETEDVPLRLDNRVYILKVVYDGELATDVRVFSEPDGKNGAGIVLPLKTSVLVTDADHYEIREDGTEDFWYEIKSGDTCGWVFGGDLFIEGYDWKNRLETRGRLIEWEQVESLIESYRSDSSKGQTAIVHTSVTAAKSSNNIETSEDKIERNTKQWIIYVLILGFSVFALLIFIVRKRIAKKSHSI